MTSPQELDAKRDWIALEQGRRNQLASDRACRIDSREVGIASITRVGSCKMGTDAMAVADPTTLKIYALIGCAWQARRLSRD